MDLPPKVTQNQNTVNSIKRDFEALRSQLLYQRIGCVS